MERIPVIRTENLTKIFKGRTGFKKTDITAVNGLNIEVYRGEVFGFLGPNGAGKSTTIKVLMRLLFPTEGNAWLFGKDIRDPLSRERVGFLPENPYFYDYLTAQEFLRLNGSLYGIRRRDIKERVEELLSFVDMQEAKGMHLRKFSKGMLQRIGIAQALMNDPDLVILDEPTSGLDPLGRRMVLELIKELAKQGRTVFFSTHILPDVEAVSDRVAIIDRGVLKTTQKLSELKGNTYEKEVIISNITKEELDKETLDMEIISTSGKEFRLLVKSEEDLYKLLDLTRREGGKLVSIIERKKTLEDLFLDIVKEREN